MTNSLNQPNNTMEVHGQLANMLDSKSGGQSSSESTLVQTAIAECLPHMHVHSMH